MDEQLKHKIEILEEHGFTDESTAVRANDHVIQKFILKFPGVSPAYWPVFWTDGDMETVTYNDLGEPIPIMVWCNEDPYYGDWRTWSDEKLIEVISGWKHILKTEVEIRYNEEIEKALEAL